MKKMTIEEHQKAYVNMENIIDEQKKKIIKLEQETQDIKNKYSKQVSELREKFSTEIELMAGVELENREVVKSKSKNAILLQNIRILLEHSSESFQDMYSNFERTVKKDISNQASHSSLSPKQIKAVDNGLKHHGITNTK